MRIDNRPWRTIWLEKDGSVGYIDQTALPFKFQSLRAQTSQDLLEAIRDMEVRGAGLIGATAAFGMYLAACEAPEEGWLDYLEDRAAALLATRPTASNLARGVEAVLADVQGCTSLREARDASRHRALQFADQDAAFCRQIGLHGLGLIQELYQHKQRTINILTHCNAGWLAFVDHGSALSPVYAAFDAGIPVHVWVDETRPRNQGASLTCWELGKHGVSHTLVCDNAGGLLMQQGKVDLAIVGADRVSPGGNVANKIGTYLKALAAADTQVPFVVAFPSSTIDWRLSEDLDATPIEERNPAEVSHVRGLDAQGQAAEVRICPAETRIANHGFDITPARLISWLVTENGLCRPGDLDRLHPQGDTE